MSVGTNFSADEESQCRLGVRDSSVAKVSINILGNIFFLTIKLLRAAPSE
jgi:hypothetical protein